ncbi:hypothetical protein Pjdr2_4135 [Paenibacillus sp. JDR-2]|nr:hypothetical protein Pjdr2_4135 [Paenibacillus sp. JDR-2]
MILKKRQRPPLLWDSNLIKNYSRNTRATAIEEHSIAQFEAKITRNLVIL